MEDQLRIINTTAIITTFRAMHFFCAMTTTSATAPVSGHETMSVNMSISVIFRLPLLLRPLLFHFHDARLCYFDIGILIYSHGHYQQ